MRKHWRVTLFSRSTNMSATSASRLKRHAGPGARHSSVHSRPTSPCSSFWTPPPALWRNYLQPAWLSLVRGGPKGNTFLTSPGNASEQRATPFRALEGQGQMECATLTRCVVSPADPSGREPSGPPAPPTLNLHFQDNPGRNPSR